MNRRTVLAPTTLLAVVVLALVAMVGAYLPRSYAAGSAGRIAPVAHVAETTATLETTTQAAASADFDLVPGSFKCFSNRTGGGTGLIVCRVSWFGGKAPFNPKFTVHPEAFTNPRTTSSPATPRTAEFNIGCFRNREYGVTVTVSDKEGKETSTLTAYIACGNQ